VAKDGKTVIAAIEGVNGGLRYLDMGTGRETKNFDIGGNVEHFDVNPSGIYIAIGSLNRKIYVFDTRKQAVAKTWKGPKGWVTDVSFNNTGEVLYSGSNDNNVFAWLAVGTQHMPIYHTRRDIDAVACSPNGKYLAVLATNEKLVVLDVAHVEEELKRMDRMAP
jgi:WD40 repeat protein